MGRKTGLEAGRAGPRSLFSVKVVGPGCHRAVTAAATVSLLGFTVFCRTGPGGFWKRRRIGAVVAAVRRKSRSLFQRMKILQATDRVCTRSDLYDDLPASTLAVLAAMP